MQAHHPAYSYNIAITRCETIEWRAGLGAPRTSSAVAGASR